MTFHFKGLNMKLTPMMVEKIERRLEHAQKKHPDGATMSALLDEFMEAEHEFYSNDYVRYEDELLDVIAVALRLIDQANETKSTGFMNGGDSLIIRVT